MDIFTVFLFIVNSFSAQWRISYSLYRAAARKIMNGKAGQLPPAGGIAALSF
jgi:hypothetical protein